MQTKILQLKIFEAVPKIMSLKKSANHKHIYSACDTVCIHIVIIIIVNIVILDSSEA